MKNMAALKQLQEVLAPLQRQVTQHRIYHRLETIEELRIFMEHHVYAVWDFMSLLKALQRHLTCVEIPWVPRGDSLSRRLINEIVLEEESDLSNDGAYISHFELYRAAMEQCGADVSKIDRFLQAIARGREVGQALADSYAPMAAQVFVRTTMTTVRSGAPHRIAAAFTLGREDVIPVMFKAVVAKLQSVSFGQLICFQDYLERHIKLDEERHTPMALQMLVALCGDDARKWQEAEATARIALKARIALWDGVTDQIAEGDRNQRPFLRPPATDFTVSRNAIAPTKINVRA